MVPEDMEVAGEALDASCLLGPTVPDATGASGLKQDGAAGRCRCRCLSCHPMSERVVTPLCLTSDSVA